MTTNPKRIVIVGAGPAGLLSAIFLLRRNSGIETSNYHVTVVDPGDDYGKLDSDGLSRKRSWMIGLTCHGLAAIKQIPGLYEEYVHSMGVDIKYSVVGIGTKFMLKVDVKEMDLADAAFTVDRNYIVAALARYLNDHFGKSADYVSHYYTKALFVDGEKKRVLVRHGDDKSESSGDQYIDYDLILGCDGIRSVVRNAFVTVHRDFEFDLQGGFSSGKSVHIPLPKDVDEGTFMFLAGCMPNVNAFVLPETGCKVNIGFGYKLNKPCANELHSGDVKVVSEYFKSHFKAFKVDYDIIAKEWVNQTWNTLGMGHCNFYHSVEIGALLLGDAAHATLPNIGQGMNTALADAAALNKLLDRFGDDNLHSILPAFSEERVKEGNALTDLSYYTFSLSSFQQACIIIRQEMQDFLHRRIPVLFDMHPMSAIGVKGMDLSEAYHKMSKLGIIQRVRRVNDGITRDYFEKKVGMIKRESFGGWNMIPGLHAWMLPLFVAGVVALRYQQSDSIEGTGNAMWKLLVLKRISV